MPCCNSYIVGIILELSHVEPTSKKQSLASRLSEKLKMSLMSVEEDDDFQPDRKHTSVAENKVVTNVLIVNLLLFKFDRIFE